ncbi:MAG: hypothetical protein WAJ95_06645, partial [Desulfobacterales bacterium]
APRLFEALTPPPPECAAVLVFGQIESQSRLRKIRTVSSSPPLSTLSFGDTITILADDYKSGAGGGSRFGPQPLPGSCRSRRRWTGGKIALFSMSVRL